MTDEIRQQLDAAIAWSASPEGQEEIERNKNRLRGEAEKIASDREIQGDYARMPLSLF